MDIAQKVFELNKTYEIDTYEERIRRLEELWEGIPAPRHQVQNSYLIISKVVAIHLANGQKDKAWEWCQHALAYSGSFNLGGESEFLVAKVAFERGDIETARRYFKIVRKTSGKRLFQNQRSEYYSITEQS